MRTIDWGDSFQEATDTVVTVLPKLLLFIVILVVGWLIARLLAKLTNTVLERIGFDRWVERGGIARAMSGTGYDASDLMAKLVYFAVLLLTLQLAFGVFGPNPISDLLHSVVAWLPKLFIAIIIIVVAAFVAGLVRDLVRGALGGLSYGNVLATIAYVFILALGVIAALNQVGVATTVTTPVLIAVLATVGGILIVGVGGGLIGPMASRWERWLDAADRETSQIQQRARENSRSATAQVGATATDVAYDQESDTRTQRPPQ